MRRCSKKACEECTQKCLVIHGNRNPTPIVSSFFKVLLGDKFLTCLIIPPRFARTITSLVDQNVYLEDAKGSTWKVQLSSHGGCLVFEQGWEQFASDHSLEVGDFLVFSYLIGSHFVVQIYGRSGCEKLNFYKRSSGSTRSSSNAGMSFDRQTADGIRSIPAESSPPISLVNEQRSYSSVHSDSSDTRKTESNVPSFEEIPMSTVKTAACYDKAAISKPVLPNVYSEVPFYMIKRDPVDVQEVNRTCLFDLSDFEMVKDKSCFGGLNKREVGRVNGGFPNSDAKSGQPQSKKETSLFRKQGDLLEKDSVDIERSCNTSLVETADVEVPHKRCHPRDGEMFNARISMVGYTSWQPDGDSLKDVPKLKHKIAMGSGSSQQLGMTSFTDFPQNDLGSREKSNGAFRKDPLPENQKPEPLYKKPKSGVSGKDLVPQMKFDILAGTSGSPQKIVKVIPQYSNDPTITGREPTIVKMKPEEGDPITKVQGQASKVVKSEIIEYTDHSPSSSVDFSSAHAVTQSFLEFPTTSPTIFCTGRMKHDRKIVLIRDPARRLWPILYHEKIGLRVLAEGWKSIAKTNNIQEGEQCVFKVEDELESIIQVSIVTRKTI